MSATSIQFFYNDNDQRVWVPGKRVHGQVVGYRRKMLGKYQRGHKYGMLGDYDYDPPCLCVDGSIVVMLVREGLFNKEIETLPGTAELSEVGTLPLMKQEQPPWDDATREEARKWALEQPRGSDGRFVKA